MKQTQRGFTLIEVLVAVGIVGVALIVGRVTEAGGLGLIGLVVGYILGNGRSVTQGNSPGTLLARTPGPDDV